jgi:hypothetical protein
MAQFTIEVPDALLPQLEKVQDRLPVLLTQWLSIAAIAQQTIAQQSLAYEEVLDFLMTQPTPLEIWKFKVSEVAQRRLRELLDRHREGGLNESETAELDSYEELDRLMQMLKIRAYSTLFPIAS